MQIPRMLIGRINVIMLRQSWRGVVQKETKCLGGGASAMVRAGARRACCRNRFAAGHFEVIITSSMSGQWRALSVWLSM
jgi:hypothetical protein